MRLAIRVLALTAIGAAALAPSAHAQDMTTMTFAGTTIWIGGGFQYLSLPEIKFVGAGDVSATGDISNFRRQKNSDFSEYGGGGGGGIETAIGDWNGMRVTAGVKGFWTNVEHSNHSRCYASTCIVVDPSGAGFADGPPVLASKVDRNVDYWGGQLEFKFGSGQPVHAKPNLYRNDYFIIGADVRGIDQDNTLRGHADGLSIYNYAETLDTTYVGGYVGIGGEYSLGFIPGGGLYDRLGLRTFINARAGIYNAETDYHGRFAFPFVGSASKISQSNDELAFIGTISLETRKQIGARTSLSLWTDYEYISSVPEMQYAGPDHPTRIGEDDAFATRTMLRLNIGFGPSQLYDEPLK